MTGDLWHDGDGLDTQPAVHISPSEQQMVLRAHESPPVFSWADRWGHRLTVLGGRLRRRGRHLRRRAIAILAVAGTHENDTDTDLQAWLGTLAAMRRQSDDDQPEILDAAMAGVVAAVRRVTGLTPHQEQVMGALALLDGNIAEMATGEGKTLTAVMAALTAGWRGRPCHVVTANDYLARRDAELFSALYAFCGISVTHIDGETPIASRAAAHTHDVVYTTARDLLGDYLRDRIALGRLPARGRFALDRFAAPDPAETKGAKGNVVMRGLFQVIVDEADSVLIDEAITPLIISSPSHDQSLEKAAMDAVALASQLVADQDYRINRSLRTAELTATGRDNLGGLTSHFSAFWQSPARSKELVEQALYAQHLLVRDQHYVIDGDKIILVDELTGRLADQRTLSHGMQQVLEAVNHLPISPPTKISQRLSFQRFFQRFPRLGGMTGTAEEARAEMTGVYRLPTLRIPTHRPIKRIHLPLRVCTSEAGKFDAVVDQALALAQDGRAVLIGVRSVRSATALHECLARKDPVTAQATSVLHAVNHAQESAIVAQAGRAGAITIATNMAGRGTDIALDDGVRAKGGLHVIIAESNDFARIDRQLIGRCGRQGDPGSVQHFICPTDELFRRFLTAFWLKRWAGLTTRHPWLARLLARPLLHQAQSKAERMSRRQRRAILEQDTQLDRIGF